MSNVKSNQLNAVYSKVVKKLSENFGSRSATREATRIYHVYY